MRKKKLNQNKVASKNKNVPSGEHTQKEYEKLPAQSQAAVSSPSLPLTLPDEILQKAVDSLVDVYGYGDQQEKENLNKLLKDRMLGALQLDGQSELQEQITFMAAPAVPLNEWYTDRLQQKVFTREFFAPLLDIARILDAFAEGEKPLIAFWEEWFSVSEDNRIIVSLPRLELARVSTQQPLPNKFQRSCYKQQVHPTLLKSLRNCNFQSAILYSFAIFLVNCLTGVSPASIPEMLDGLKKCRHLDPSLPPGLPDTLSQVISLDPMQPSEKGCLDTILDILADFQNNPFECRETMWPQAKHQSFAYSVPGLYKKRNSNEDRFINYSQGNVTFLLVADGVSTADLGSGETAAEEIRRLHEFSFKKQLEIFAEDLAALSPDQKYLWREKADSLLKDFFLEAHNRVTDLLNEELGDKSIDTVQHPMCSTLTAAIVFHDQAVIRFIGDSPAWLYRREKGDCLRLTTDHNEGMTEKFDIHHSSDSRLTRVIGVGSTENNRFIPSTDIGDGFCLQMGEGDIILLTTDGAIDCLNKGTYENEIEFMKTVRKLAAHQEGWSLTKMIRKLVTMGEEGSSHDNITVNGIVLMGENKTPVTEKAKKGESYV